MSRSTHYTVNYSSETMSPASQSLDWCKTPEAKHNYNTKTKQPGKKLLPYAQIKPNEIKTWFMAFNAIQPGNGSGQFYMRRTVHIITKSQTSDNSILHNLLKVGGQAIVNHSSRAGGCSSSGTCLSSLPYPLNNSQLS